MCRITSIVTATAVACAWLAGPIAAQDQPLRWYKGNTHTHTLNSHGDSTPDEVVRWYREHDYHFVVLSDHNFLTSVDGLNALYGADEQFLVIRGEEVTDAFEDKPIHINGIDVQSLVDPQGGNSVVEVIQRNVDAIRAASGVPHINHPNFGWAITADETIVIAEDPWSKYRVQFIGEGGRILEETITNPAVYEFRGEEPYVRAKVLESNGRVAWTQPVWRAGRSARPPQEP